MIREACVETLEEALNAEALRADRIELCSDLHMDGLTPSNELIREVKHKLGIPVKVMIRPRPGNFNYSRAEIEEMLGSIAFCRSEQVEGVVFGVLNSENELDIPAIKTLSISAAPMKVTIHKAIDLTTDPIRELERLIEAGGIHSVLSSGKAPTAIEGAAMLQRMIFTAGQRIEIIVAGRVTFENLGEVSRLIHADAYHGRKILGNLNNLTF